MAILERAIQGGFSGEVVSEKGGEGGCNRETGGKVTPEGHGEKDSGAGRVEGRCPEERWAGMNRGGSVWPASHSWDLF